VARPPVTARPAVARAETVGSLLRPPELLAARRDLSQGRGTHDRIRELEDAAVLDAIRLQEAVGLDVITDGEMRRRGWAATTEVLEGFEPRPGGPGLKWRGVGPELQTGAGYPTVVHRISARGSLAEEYSFLVDHAQLRAKYCLPAPSYHRRFWYPQHSAEAYPTCEAFLVATRDYLRAEVARLTELRCDYVQLDAPNYGSLCDDENRRRLEARGHDLDAELAFDIELDNSVFEGFPGITRALHVCRGNAAGRWHSSGGYGRIAERLFQQLNVDVLLLEYDTERAGDFGPLAYIGPATIAVLGLLTTKSGDLEEEREVEARIAQAAKVKPLAELALSPQCGFASVAVGNPLTPEEQRAKLELVARVARRTWAA